jgi:hypothetical protein
MSKKGHGTVAGLADQVQLTLSASDARRLLLALTHAVHGSAQSKKSAKLNLK